MLCKRVIYVALVAILMQHGGCIKEDLSECKEELLLSFSHTLNMDYADLFEDKVDKVEAYLFDESGLYVEKRIESSSELKNDYIMRIAVPHGVYSVVVYGGDLSCYSVGVLDTVTNQLDTLLVAGVSSIENLHIELKTYTGDDGYLYSQDSINDLYVGMVNNAISMSGNSVVTDVDLVKNTNDIAVNILGSASQSDRYDTHVVASNGRYGYDNETNDDHGVLKHTPTSSSVSGDTLSHSLTMMRLLSSTSTKADITGSDSHQLIIVDTQTSDTLYNENMVDQILSTEGYSSQDDLDRDDSYSFDVTLTDSGAITVAINGWVVNLITPAAVKIL